MNMMEEEEKEVYFNTLKEIRNVFMMTGFDQIVTNSIEFGNKNTAI